MRLSLLLEPLALLERLGVAATAARRRRRLRGTPADALHLSHFDTLELLDLVAADGPPAVIYDVGAEAGLFTVLARARFPDAVVHGFEPLPTHHARYRARVGAMPGAVLHEVALGPSEGDVPMHVTALSEASSFFPVGAAGRAAGIRSAGTVAVPVVALDAHAARHRLPPPDLIKLDVQGYEVEALRGAPAALAHARHVIAEVSFRELYAGQPLFHDVATFLAGHGYRVAAFGVATPLGRAIEQADVLFARDAP